MSKAGGRMAAATDSPSRDGRNRRAETNSLAGSSRGAVVGILTALGRPLVGEARALASDSTDEMPIRVTIDPFNRIVIGVGDGVLTISDLVFLRPRGAAGEGHPLWENHRPRGGSGRPSPRPSCRPLPRSCARPGPMRLAARSRWSSIRSVGELAKIFIGFEMGAGAPRSSGASTMHGGG